MSAAIIAAAMAAMLSMPAMSRGQATPEPVPPAPPATPTAAERESRPLGRPREQERPLDTLRGSNAGQRTSSPSWIDHPLVRTGGSLAVVLGLIYGLARVARRVNGRAGAWAGAIGGSAAAPSGLIEVLGRYPVGRGQTLMLLRVDTRVLLVAQTAPGLRLRGGGGGGALTTLCEMTAAEDVASVLMKVQDAEQASTAAKFSDLLGRFDARHGESARGVLDLPAQGRRARATAAGDRAELWDPASAIPESGSLRDRLRSIRSGAGGGGTR